VDAAVELTAAGYAVESVIVNRVRPTLVQRGQITAKGNVNVRTLTAGLTPLSPAIAELARPLAEQMREYAIRQDEQVQTATRLDTIECPRIELPDLTPPVELGELNELSQYFHHE
jgi:hypothetical protein